jgi:hypothetical protein
MYWASSCGVAGRERGGRFRACRCLGSRGMSSHVSGLRQRGEEDRAMLRSKSVRRKRRM